MELTEIITRREPMDLRGLPSGSVVHFEREIVGHGMRSVVRDRLTAAGARSTLWLSENKYRFDSVLMRLVGLVLPGSFRARSLQHLRDFNAFAEEGTDVRQAQG